MDTLLVEKKPNIEIAFTTKSGIIYPVAQGRMLIKIPEKGGNYTIKSIKFKIEEEWIVAFKTEEEGYLEWNKQQNH